jgi:intraflagellar transport protein 20
MAEIKSFRISDETKERLEALSASIGGNKDRVFNTLMDAYSLEQEKVTVTVTDQAKNIETFEQYTNTLVRLYLEALRAVSSSDDRIRGEFHNQLEENAQTIKELRDQRDRMADEANLEKAKAKKEVTEVQEKNKELMATIERLEKSLAAAEEQANAKQAMNEMLLSQAKQAEKEKEQYEQMTQHCQALEKQLEDEKATAIKMKQTLEDELRQAISEKEKAAYEAELLKKEEIRKAEGAIRKEKDIEIAQLQKQLFELQSKQLSDQSALQEAKTALLSLRLELSESYQKGLNELRLEKDKKIEALQSELLKAFNKK